MSDCKISKETAIALSESEFWVEMSAIQIAKFQMEVKRMCLPFEVFHKSIEDALSRQVQTIEFGLNWDGLKSELFDGALPLSFDELISLLPEGKAVIILNESQGG